MKKMTLDIVICLFFGRIHGIPERDKGNREWRGRGNYKVETSKDN